MAKIKEKKDMPPIETAFKGRQLDLFQDFLCNTSAERERLSNTIELWDAVPKYHINRRRQGKLRKDGFLPIAKKNFVYRGKEMTVSIIPALINVNGQSKAFYPAAREELVEDALRKLACQPSQGYFDNNRSGVMFTLHQLRNELKKNGHTLSYYEVVEALEILSLTNIKIAPLNGKSIYVTSPLTSLLGVSKNDLKNDPSSKWYADFSILVTEGIKLIKYRQYDYALSMSLKSQLARYLHKRICHNYVQASMLNPYSITMQGIARDSGLLECTRAKNNRKMLENALDELKENEIIIYYEGEEIRGKRNALEDVRYKISPHPNFIAQVKRANKRLSLANE